jgi:hypothetical protein
MLERVRLSDMPDKSLINKYLRHWIKMIYMIELSSKGCLWKKELDIYY